MRISRVRPAVAAALVVAVTAAFGAPPLPNAQLSGRVLNTDNVSPRAGVVVLLVDADQRAYASEPTNDEGAFKIESAPPGSYSLVAETAEGAFLATAGLELQAGPNEPVALTLKTGAPDLSARGGLAADGGGLPRWGKWLIVGAITIFAFIGINDAIEDTTEASGFTPG